MARRGQTMLPWVENMCKKGQRTMIQQGFAQKKRGDEESYESKQRIDAEA